MTTGIGPFPTDAHRVSMMTVCDRRIESNDCIWRFAIDSEGGRSYGGRAIIKLFPSLTVQMDKRRKRRTQNGSRDSRARLDGADDGNRLHGDDVEAHGRSATSKHRRSCPDGRWAGKVPLRIRRSPIGLLGKYKELTRNNEFIPGVRSSFVAVAGGHTCSTPAARGSRRQPRGQREKVGRTRSSTGTDVGIGGRGTVDGVGRGDSLQPEIAALWCEWNPV